MISSLTLIAISLTGLVWIAVAGRALHVQRKIPWLDVRARGERAGQLVTVVVPARNEVQGIESALRSLLDQQEVVREVVAVNDGSTDGTAELLDRIAADEPRLRVLHNPALPAGWLGKTNAMHQGAALASGEYILFSDADIVHQPGTIAAALAAMESAELDMLTLGASYRWESLLEQIWVPFMVLVLLVFGSTRYRDPDHPDDAIGIGTFAMVRRTAYETAGGHEPIRASIVDDADLGRLIKRSGFSIDVQWAPKNLEVRMFTGNVAAFWGLTKNVLGVADGRVSTALGSAVMVALLYGVGAPAAAFGLLAGDALVAAGGIALYALQYLTFFGMRSWQRFRPLKLLAYPLASVAVLACALRASYYMLARGTVRWRGREVKLR